MRVLHLPFNVSSQISVTVAALRSLGVEARGFARNFSAIQDYAAIETMEWVGKPQAVARLWRGIRWRWKLVRAMAWADLLHWYWGESTWRGLDLRIAARLGKPRLIEFWGDDLRCPAIASQDNPYIARMYEQNPELAQSHSKTVQRLFRKHGFACLLPGYELADYLLPSLFPGYYQTRQRLELGNFKPRFPDPCQERPLIVHASSDKTRKGTEAVLRAVEKLAQRHSFDFKLIHQMPRSEALEAVAQCDVFLDQFTIGAEGLAALEAMALGKPVVCFIKPSLRDRYPPDLPVVVGEQGNLAETVAPLLENGQRRHEIGVRSREFIEQHYDSRKIAGDLVEIYEDLHSRKGCQEADRALCRHWRCLNSRKKGGAG